MLSRHSATGLLSCGGLSEAYCLNQYAAVLGYFNYRHGLHCPWHRPPEASHSTATEQTSP